MLTVYNHVTNLNGTELISFNYRMQSETDVDPVEHQISDIKAPDVGSTRRELKLLNSPNA